MGDYTFNYNHKYYNGFVWTYMNSTRVSIYQFYLIDNTWATYQSDSGSIYLWTNLNVKNTLGNLSNALVYYR